MTKDKALEELFLAQTPHFDDSAEFMAKLTKRLEAVEIVKRYQERTLHRYRVLLVVAFVVGIISGTVSTIWLLSSPIDEPLFSFSVQANFLIWLAHNSRLFVAAGLSLLMTAGICSIVSNILDIIEMRRSMEENRSWVLM